MKPSLSKRFLDFVSSVRFTIFLLVALAAILAVATVIESREGTGAVQLKVYRAAWFNFFLVAFAVNMLGGSFKRFRLLWVHLGFGITHLAVMVILLGAFLTRNFGIEGQMTIPEGAVRDYFVENDDKLTVTGAGEDDKAALWVPIERGARVKELLLSGRLGKSGVTVRVDQYYPDLNFEQVIEPGGSVENPALEYSLDAMGSEVSGWLASRVPQRQAAEMGPLTLDFQESAVEPVDSTTGTSSTNLLIFTSKDGKHTQEIEATPGTTAAVSLGGLSFAVTIKDTFGNFTMSGRDFEDRPGVPDNPAVTYTIRGPKGEVTDLAFAKYPSFSLQHGKQDTGFTTKFLFRGGPVGRAGSRLTVYWVGRSKLQYVLRASSKRIDAGALELGKPLEMLDGKMHFSVKQFLPSARISSKAVNSTDEVRNPALHVLLASPTGTTKDTWALWGEPREVDLDGKKLTLVYRGDHHSLPFSLKLVKFKMDKYPGTNQPATYESKVFLSDTQTGRSEELVISMNEPLLYRGYTFFQSSYIPGDTYTTVLSVSRDPGKWPTYIGYILMTLGLIVMFYFKSYLARWDQARLRKESAQ